MDIKSIAEKISNAGGKVYLVGGAVRNIILGLEPKDYDYCITGLSVKEFLKLFPDSFLRGKEFPVFDIDGTEFALARKERKIGIGHTAFQIETNKNITIEEDLERRDITINSIAIDVLTNEIIDPFNGKEDCKNKIIRATSKAFSEDPLRVYRVARFAAEYGFDVDNDTKKLMSDLKNELSTLSAERVFVEFKKALLSNNPSQFFLTLRDTNCLDIHFKEIYDMIGIQQPLKYHPEGDVFNHTMEVIERCAKQTNSAVVRFSALVHDFGKITTPKEILPHHYNHENKGDNLIREFCNRIKAPTNWKKAGITSCHEHMKAGKFDELKATTKVDFLSKNAKTILGLKGLEIIANSDKARENRIEFANLGKKMLEEINGKTIDIEGLDYIKINEKIRQKRIEWIKNQSFHI